jgi:MerR family redox-sensitive transcriptional activator SoxR
MEMSIGDLAGRAGLAASTIRYYEEVGLLPPAARMRGRRVFDEQTLDRLLVIAFAKEAGFSLREIRQLFAGFASDTPAGARWQKLATAKLAEVEALAARIDTMKQLLREALRCGCVELDACGKLFRARADQLAR